MDKNVVHYRGLKEFMMQGINEKHLKNVELKLLMQMGFGNLIAISKIRLREELVMDEQQINDAFEMSWDCIRYIE